MDLYNPLSISALSIPVPGKTKLTEEFETLQRRVNGIEGEASVSSISVDARINNLYLLNLCYQHGYGTPKDRLQAQQLQNRAFENGGITRLRETAERGDRISQYILGVHYLKSQNREELRSSFGWIHQSAKQGYPSSQFLLGALYEFSAFYNYRHWNTQQGRYETRPVDKHCAFSTFITGELEDFLLRISSSFGFFRKYPSFREKMTKATEWYNKAAQQSHFLAQYVLGRWDDGVWPALACLNYNPHDQYSNKVANLNIAYSWYRLSALQGYYKAAYRLGMMITHHRGTYKITPSIPLNEGLDWLRFAALNGHRKAACALSRLPIVEEKEQVYWLEFAAKSGHVEAKNLLRDRVQKAYEDYLPGQVKSNFDREDNGLFGLHFCLGVGTKRDLNEANQRFQEFFKNGGFERLQRSAKSGGDTAQIVLGWILLNGTATLAPCEEKAVKWFNRAVDKNKERIAEFESAGFHPLRKDGSVGYHLIQFNLSRFLFTPQEEAYEWFKEEKGERKNCYYSQFFSHWFLGMMHEYGLGGLRRDLKKAELLYQEGALCYSGLAMASLAKVTGQSRFSKLAQASGVIIDVSNPLFNPNAFIFKDISFLNVDIESAINSLFETPDDGKNTSCSMPSGTEKCDDDGNTPLHFACLHNRHWVVSRLLSRHANPNSLNKLNETPLIVAIKYYPYLRNPIDIIQALTPLTNLDCIDRKGLSAIAWAVVNGNIAALKILMGLDTNVVRKELERSYGDDENSLLLMSVKANSLPVTKFLLKKGWDATFVNNKKENALHVCAQDKRNKLGSLLIAAGTSINEKNSLGRTPFQVAVDSGHVELIMALFACHLLFGIASKQLKCSDQKVFNHLLSLGGDVNQRDGEGRTLLHIAASCGNEPFARFLLNEKKADKRVRDNSGNSINKVATKDIYQDGGRLHQPEIIELLKKVGAASLLKDKEINYPRLLSILELIRDRLTPTEELKAENVADHYSEVDSKTSSNKPRSFEVNHNGIKYNFEENEVDGDGNCGLTAIGIDREELYNTLKRCVNDEAIRKRLTKEVADAFAHGFIQDKGQWKQASEDESQNHKKLIETLAKFRRAHQKLPIYNQLKLKEVCSKSITWLSRHRQRSAAQELRNALSGWQNSKNKLRAYCRDKKVVLDYLRAYQSDGDRVWLGCQSALIYAEQKEMFLTIWDYDSYKNNIKMKLSNAPSPNEGINLIFTGTHYNLLNLVPEEVESETRELTRSNSAKRTQRSGTVKKTKSIGLSSSSSSTPSSSNSNISAMTPSSLHKVEPKANATGTKRRRRK